MGIQTFLDFLARLAISAIFISAIPGKIAGFGRTDEYISSKVIPNPSKSGIYESRINRWITYFYIKGTKIK